MNRLKGQNKTHLQWVDHTKLLACALVVLGHFAQSMVRAGILPDTVAYTLCNSALYTFHVPLFFICSAYLYRRFTVLRTCRDYARHVGKKALALGVPYFTFAGANYALKLLFPAGVNMAEERGPVAYFFLNPPAPFWYLPVLFLFFVLIPPAGKKGSLALIALGLCTYFICGLSAAAVLPGCVRSLLQNLIWFAMGLALANAPADLLRKKPLPLLLGTGFLLLAGITFTLLRGNRALLLLCGLLACGAVLSAMQLWHPGEKLRRALNLCSRDTFPIYLLHTICAAPVRSLLLHFGVQNPVVHIALGLAASFLLPMAAGRIAARVPVFNFFLYPTRYILKKQAAPCAAVGEP